MQFIKCFAGVLSYVRTGNPRNVLAHSWLTAVTTCFEHLKVNHSCVVTRMLHARYISLIFVTLQSPPPDENHYPLQHRLIRNH